MNEVKGDAESSGRYGGLFGVDLDDADGVNINCDGTALDEIAGGELHAGCFGGRDGFLPRAAAMG